MEGSKLVVLLTGVTGFVGGALLAYLSAANKYSLRACTRDEKTFPQDNIKTVRFKDFNGNTPWGEGLKDVDVVVHSAARVHVMNEVALDPLAEFREVNVRGTLNLARQAAAAGVKRFVFISSVKVSGEESFPGFAYKTDGVASPSDPYGVSKFEAENELLALSAETNMDVVIVRPVLVYGPGVKANFLNMMKFLDRRIPLPLPFGSISNKRSFVSLDNLIDFLALCLEHPAAANQIFFVSDGEDLSTPQLLRMMATALGKKAFLIPVPEKILVTAAKLLKREELSSRLCGSLQVDIKKNHDLLGWTPPVSVSASLAKTAKSYLESKLS